MTRRKFLKTCAALSFGATVSPALNRLAPAHANSRARNPLAIFAKPLQSVSPDELGKRLASMSVDGIEATFRKGGQLEPAQFANQLPAFCDALGKHNQRVIIATTDVNEVTQANQEQLKLFADNNIPYFRMAYYHYDFSKPLIPQLESFAKLARELAQLCSSLGITGLYQNHAGAKYVGAALWDLHQVLSEIDPKHISVALDLRHTTLELTESWTTAYELVKPQIGAVFVKDFAWIDGKAQNVPLGSGRAEALWKRLKQDGFTGPISLHVEYIDHQPDALLNQRWDAIETDVAVLKKWIAG